MNSPRVRLIITLVLTIIIGVLSSLFATEITPDGVIDWALTYKTFSFWGLLVTSVIWILIHLIFLKHDENILRFTDDAHCIGHIRKTKLDGYAALVKDDPKQANLINVTDLLKDLKVKTR
ncbi:hypothetical protein [Pseudoalteromonas tunicata]|uniref:Uncharacterized protein n=1 Tax=Pseudoalteromonas tunicata D2 TaxID=87626 RepID=A4CAV1_9GAMM|nr:hypothetical protein [Pseudoalteromonas tunicata]AXT30702.1 hypothetical protein D1819_07635 [Pseudoalteromonas tunicata]EAR28509.1 hypothetical protein PTD2_21877 [Pseudoalteromonas tunicata D2]